MNKKLIISLSTIAAVAIIAIGASVAYFSNTETSSGNTFIAGAIDLKIDNECHLNGKVCTGGFWQGTTDPCDCTWKLMDLDGKAIFNFTDVKPGDDGEDTISLHVDSNPAWVCAEVSNVTQMENGCNLPESKVDDPATSCDNPGVGQGELWDNLRFSIWMDDNCDNILNGEETYLVENAKATDLKWPIADSQTGGSPIRNACIGVAWHVPDAVGNIIQGDSVTGDITFNAYQARHNDSFLCNPPPEIVCGNGQKENGEECDNGAANGEPCDPEYGGSCDYCSTECTIVNLTDGYCGNGIIESPYEVCDDGALNGTPNHCNSTCSGQTMPLCGNGTVESGEQCDDGNNSNDDGCSETCQSEPAYIVIHKEVINNDVCTKQASDFTMTLDGVGAIKDTPINTGDTNSHAISETDIFGYIKTYSGDCDVNGNVTTAWNQTKTCNVINTCPYGTITVTKTVTNNDGGSLTVGSFTLKIDGNTVTSGNPKNVAVGAHTVSEVGVFGYSATFSVDCDSSGHVTVAAGETKSCTITNNDIAPSITLIKSVVGGNPPADPDEFDVSIDGAIKSSGSSNSVMANTAHVIDEEATVSGYSFTSPITGTSYLGVSCPAALEGTITLLPGDVVTCTITNTKPPG